MTERYRTIKQVLQKFCKNEGLRFIETALENPKIQFMRFADKVVLNSNYAFEKGEKSNDKT